MNDQEILQKCKEYGRNARKWMREFAMLLPLVWERGLHRRSGCASIQEFAGKMAGMSHEVCNIVLSIYQRLPEGLWLQLPEHGWAKLKIVAGAVDLMTEDEWLKALVLPREALRKLVQKKRIEQEENLFSGTIENGAGEVFGLETSKSTSGKSDCSVAPDSSVVEHSERISFRLNADTKFKLKRLQIKLQKERKGPVTLGECLDYLLREEEERELKSNKIPKKVRIREVEKHQGRCADCSQPYEEFHHLDRYSISHKNDNVLPLCRSCHQIRHVISARNEAEERVDQKVQAYWRGG